jgi:hypothetical protein
MEGIEGQEKEGRARENELVDDLVKGDPGHEDTDAGPEGHGVAVKG